MASSNIKLFDENKGNMLSDSEFSISNQRMNGLQTGIASSQLQNKAMYQASLVAYAIAQVMMQNGKNANDTDAVSAFVSNLSGTMLQKVYDIATTAEAQAGVATGKWMSPALVKTAMNYMLANPVTFGSTVTLAGDPTENLQAATKQYVDKKIGGIAVAGKSIVKDYRQLLGTFNGRFYNAKAYGTVPQIKVYAFESYGIITCDWSGSAGSNESFDGFEVNISGKYYMIGCLCSGNKMICVPTAADDEASGSGRYDGEMGSVFSFSLGTWVNTTKIHCLWFCPSPIIRKNTAN